MKRFIPLLLFLTITFAITGPLATSFYTEDDFDHLLAAIDGAEFSGRDGWYNYIPLTGLIWRACWIFGYTESAVALRLIVWILLATSAYALCRFVSSVSNRPQYGVLTGLVFIIHPALFEPVIRLSCMHYLLGLALQLFALKAAYIFIDDGRFRIFVMYMCSAALSILASLHSISIIPLTAVLGLTMFLCGRPINIKRILLLVAGVTILAALTLSIMLKIGILDNRPQGSSFGQFIVEHAWLVYYLFSWHVPLGAQSYIALCTIRVLGIPVLPFFVLLLPAAAYVVIVWRCKNKRRDAAILIAFSLAGVIISSLVPPKAHAMSRYMFYAGPWASIIIAALILRLANLKIIGRVLVAVLVAMLCCSSIWWYYHQIKYQRLASHVTSSFVNQVMRSNNREAVAVDNLPRKLGVDLPFHRSSWYWIKQVYLSITPPIVEESNINYLAVKWADNPRWELYPDSDTSWNANTTLLLNWDDSANSMIREQTASHLRLTLSGSTEGEP